VIDNDDVDVAPSVRCAGLDVAVVGNGLLARDGLRWAWVFRSPPELGGFSSSRSAASMAS